MATNKAANTTSPHECCMCGDHGFALELFQCKVCQFRSQHRYCSNLYPNIAESQYRTCNWCLTLQNKEEKSQNSSNSSSSCRNDVVQEQDKTTSSKIKITNKNNHTISNYNNNKNDHSKVGALILRRQGASSSPMNLQQLSGPIKKQRSVEIVLPSPPTKSSSPSPAPPIRKRVLTIGAKEERLRRTRSEEISNPPPPTTTTTTPKQVIRNKVRRYKLLDEVSS